MSSPTPEGSPEHAQPAGSVDTERDRASTPWGPSPLSQSAVHRASTRTLVCACAALGGLCGLIAILELSMPYCPAEVMMLLLALTAFPLVLSFLLHRGHEWPNLITVLIAFLPGWFCVVFTRALIDGRVVSSRRLPVWILVILAAILAVLMLASSVVNIVCRITLAGKGLGLGDHADGQDMPEARSLREESE